MKPSSEIVCDLQSPATQFRPNSSFGVPELDQRSSAAKPPHEHAIFGAITGVLAGFSETGAPLVDFAGNESSHPLIARATLPVTASQVGQDVVLLFERADLAQPIIIGCIQPAQQPEGERPVDVRLNGERLVFTAGKEIVLRCGKSSITLTRAGKVLIRGEYLLSRSSGVNRIKGGSVQIN
jgi:hypothetical protein